MSLIVGTLLSIDVRLRSRHRVPWLRVWGLGSRDLHTKPSNVYTFILQGHFDLLRCYLEGQGHLVSGLIMGIARVTMWVIGITKTYLLSLPEPLSRSQVQSLGLRV